MAATVAKIRESFGRLYRSSVAGGGSGRLVAGTLELLGASFLADEDTIFGRVNEDYIRRELEWYRSRSLRVEDIPGVTPRIWHEVASDTGLVNSNYGYLLYGPENCSQFEHVVSTLVRERDSRRAVAIYTRPSMQTEWNAGGMRDFVCTNAVHYELRDGRLHLVVQMRSGDAVFGYKNDVAWQRYTQSEVCSAVSKELGEPVTPGLVHWQVASLHVYERHFPLVERYLSGE